MEIKNGDEWLLIEGSKEMDWNMIVTDPEDTRIDWLKKEIGEGGLTESQHILSEFNDLPNNTYAFKPIIFFPNKAIAQIYFDGSDGQSSRMDNAMPAVTIDTDQAGNPISARISFFRTLGAHIYEEGTNSDITFHVLIDYGEGFKALKENQIYYAAIAKEQDYVLNHYIHASISNWEGISSNKTNFDVLNGNSKNNDLLLNVIMHLIKKAN
ncbi:MAG: hypothetical protein JXI43_07890 [Tissierellales bacterium]|nr:hypothetical protein [Tissierellales bacterium]